MAMSPGLSSRVGAHVLLTSAVTASDNLPPPQIRQLTPQRGPEVSARLILSNWVGTIDLYHDWATETQRHNIITHCSTAAMCVIKIS